MGGPRSRYGHPVGQQGGQPNGDGPLGAGELLTDGFLGALILSRLAWRDPCLHWVIQGKKTNFWELLKQNQ